MFRRGIADDDREVHEARHGGGVDDVSESLLGHDVVGGVDAVDDPPQIDIDDLFPVVKGRIPGICT